MQCCPQRGFRRWILYSFDDTELWKKDNGYVCHFYPWAQLEVSKDFIDSLEEGQVLDFSGWEDTVQ